MNTTLTLNDIYVMLSTLSDSDKLWLADKLVSEVEDRPRRVKIKSRGKDLSDDQLSAELSKYPDITDIPEADVHAIIKGNSGKALESMRKYLDD